MRNDGLSVLIPVYNFGIVPLVSNLHLQLTLANVAFEIRVYDDGSAPEYKKKNLPLITLENVVYHELPYNIGRSSIRNRLAEEARFENLLFLDGDMEVMANDYIKNVVSNLANKNTIVIGGTCYAPAPPANTEYLLHWYAGKTKEEKPASHRNVNPYSSFTLNNMLIHKQVFLSIKLNEFFQTYGHEDSFFGYQLAQKGIRVAHIDNPICHIGLNSANDYLKKTQSAVVNLHRMIHQYRAGTDTKLYKTFKWLNSFLLINVYYKLFLYFEPTIKKNLLSDKPKLILLDVWKLGIFCGLYLNKPA